MMTTSKIEAYRIEGLGQRKMNLVKKANLLEVGDKQAQPIALPVDSSRAIMQQYAVI